MRTNSATAPTASNNLAAGYNIGDHWKDSTTGYLWRFASESSGSATWVVEQAGGLDIVTPSQIVSADGATKLGAVATSNSYDDLDDQPAYSDLSGLPSAHGSLSAATGAQAVASSEATITGASVALAAAWLTRGAQVSATAVVEVTTYTGSTDTTNYLRLLVGDCIVGEFVMDGQGTAGPLLINGVASIGATGASGDICSTYSSTNNSGTTIKSDQASIDTTAATTVTVVGVATTDTVEVNVHALSYTIRNA